jgi:GNAT superfamily N-acetyltransferase
MNKIVPTKVKIDNNVDKALSVMHDAANWLIKSGKNPNKWWQPKNMNRKFMLKQAEPNEFYVLLIDSEPAGAVILQDNERNQSWESYDGKNSKKALYLHWLCVTREYAGKGIPKLLTQFAKNEARKRNLKRIRVDSNAEEKKLCDMYKRLGFTQVHEEAEDYRKAAFFEMIL